MRTFILAAFAALAIIHAASALQGQPMLMDATTATPPPGTIFCANGQPYVGTIPAGAVAAGFTTCAFNLDIAQLTSLSQFLDCAGASTPLLYNNPNAGGGGLGMDCSAYAIVNDAGSNVLRMRVPAGTATPKGAELDFHNSASPPTAGNLFPQTKYLELRVRWGTNTNGNCVSCDLQGIFTYRSEPDPGLTVPWMELDDWECFAGNGPPSLVTCQQRAHVAAMDWCCFGLAEYNAAAFNYAGAGFTTVAVDVTAWHTYGIRLVSDGAANLTDTVGGNASWCTYHDGTLDVCSHGGYGNNCGGTCSQDAFQKRERVSLQNILQQAGTLGANQDLYISRITYWECSNWQAATSVTQNGNNCLNSTAAVTGALTGAP